MAKEEYPELHPGDVLVPDRQAFQDAPNGMQLHQEYDFQPGRYQLQGRQVGTPWETVAEFVWKKPYTYGAQIIFAEQVGWQYVYTGPV